MCTKTKPIQQEFVTILQDDQIIRFIEIFKIIRKSNTDDPHLTPNNGTVTAKANKIK